MRRTANGARKPSVVKSEGILDIHGAIEAAKRGDFSVTPLQLLGVILKSILRERITDEEIDKISVLYYDTIVEWWG